MFAKIISCFRRVQKSAVAILRLASAPFLSPDRACLSRSCASALVLNEKQRSFRSAGLGSFPLPCAALHRVFVQHRKRAGVWQGSIAQRLSSFLGVGTSATSRAFSCRRSQALQNRCTKLDLKLFLQIQLILHETRQTIV